MLLNPDLMKIKMQLIQVFKVIESLQCAIGRTRFDPFVTIKNYSLNKYFIFGKIAGSLLEKLCSKELLQ